MKNNELLKSTRASRLQYANYLSSNWYSIWQAYEKPSYNKEKAWSYCKDLCAKLNGFDLKVISKNTFQFTAGFLFVVEDTGELGFAYITASYDRFYELVF